MIPPHLVPALVIYPGSSTKFIFGATVFRECMTDVPRHQILGTESGTFSPIIVFIKVKIVGLLVLDKVYTFNANRGVQIFDRETG